jgi:opacity protein-like surface antigen
MRNTIVGLTCVILALPVAAQSRGPTDKGSILVAGSASIVRSTSEVGDVEVKTTGVSLNPSLLFFIAPKFAIGGQLGLSRVSNDDGDATSWLLGPAARLYFGEPSARTLPYVGAGVSFGGFSTDDDDSDQNFSSDLWGFEGVAGLTWMVSRQVGITGEAFFERATIESDDAVFSAEQTRTDFGIRFGFAAFLFR